MLQNFKKQSIHRIPRTVGSSAIAIFVHSMIKFTDTFGFLLVTFWKPLDFFPDGAVLGDGCSCWYWQWDLFGEKDY